MPTRKNNSGLPIRTPSHVLRDKSVNILCDITTNNKWIFRPNDQKDDYGIDGEIELVRRDGALDGKILKVQVKGHNDIVFEDGVHKEPNIKISTAHYWIGFNMPVIIFAVDINKKKAYWADAVREVRRNYPKEAEQATISLSIRQDMDYAESASINMLVRKVFGDFNWKTTILEIRQAIEEYPAFLTLWQWSHQADYFLHLEDSENKTFKKYHKLISHLCFTHYIDDEKVKDTNYWYKKSLDEWKNSGELTYAICAEACDNIMPNILELFRHTKNIISKQERTFWVCHDFDFLEMVEMFDIPESAEESTLLAYIDKHCI